MNREIRIKNKVGGYDYPQAMLNGIDVNNVIGEYATEMDITLSQDCFIVCEAGSRLETSLSSIDGIEIYGIQATYGIYHLNFYFFGKKGQRIITNLKTTLYGIKH